uniref:Monodehydroascorbate reductase n=1 Tax=Tanacetum cinerariifolium TaxID=118510 RepID=A0A6L2P2V7_TANCI|nr:hypothetical protein [Tanacetum cinerariifolium]
MDMTIDQQVALDEALVPHASRVKIRKSNFRLRLDITSKELTLQLVYDVLRLTPFYKVFLVTTDVPEYTCRNSREMMHICPRLPGQTFDELPFEEENLAFLRFLRHSGEIRKLTDVNINKLQQPWRSFVAVINKCLSGKSTGYDRLRLSQAQILWGMYHKKNVDFAYLLWEDFVYQVEHKDVKKSNEMYYPRFTKVIIHYFMTNDPLILRRNKVNWHYVRDDQMFTMIKLVSRHQNTQQFGVMLHVELTNEDIRNFEAYKEYYAVVSGAAPPKTKASIMKTNSRSDTTITPPTATGTRLLTFAKGKQPAKASKVKNEGTGIIPGVPDVPTEESDEEISWKSSDEDDDDVDERSDYQDDDDDQDDDQDEGDDDNQDEGNNDDQDNDNEVNEFVHPKLSIHEEEETKDEESFDPIIQTPKNSNDEGNDDASLGLNVGSEEGQDTEDDEDELYRDVNINLEGRDMNVPGLTTVASFTLSAPTLPPPTIPTSSQVQQAPTPPTTAPRTLLNRAKEDSNQEMERNKSIHRSDEQRNLYKALVEAHESYKIILDTYGDTVTLKRRHDDADKDEEPSAGSDRGSKRRREGKEPKSTSAPKKKATKTTGKSTQGSKSQQKTASKSAPAEKPIQTTHDLEEPSHQEFKTGDADDQPIAEASQHPEWFQKQKKPPTPNCAWNKTLPATHESIQSWISNLVKQADSLSSFNELMDTLVDFFAFLMNRLKVDTLTPELLAGPTYKLMKGSCKSLMELEFFLEEVYKATTDQLDWNNPEG